MSFSTNRRPMSSNIILDKDRAVEQLLELCRINAPSRKEGPVADYIRKTAAGLGLDCIDFSPDAIPSGGDTPSLLIRIEGERDGECLLLSSHMDTVPVPHDGEIRIVREGDRISTDGSSVLGGDDRTGVAASLEMARLAVQHPEAHGGVEILFTVQEELGCRGSALLDYSMIRSRHGYNLDGETPPGTLITKAPKKAKYYATVTGKSAHAALEPEKGINAIVAAAAMITELPQGAPDEFSTANIGQVSGGKQTNVVPDYAEFSGEIRSFCPESFEELKERIDRICEAKAREAGVGLDLVWEPLYEGYDISEDSLLIRRMKSVCASRGEELTLLTSRGGGDSNNLNSHGVENVVFGLGMHLIHTPGEHLFLTDYLKALDLLKDAVFYRE